MNNADIDWSKAPEGQHTAGRFPDADQNRGDLWTMMKMIRLTARL
jgi:hypothetical protein